MLGGGCGADGVDDGCGKRGDVRMVGRIERKDGRALIKITFVGDCGVCSLLVDMVFPHNRTPII
jgi:hypothetical protein